MTDPGIGYGLTAPSVTVSLPPNYVVGARYIKKSPIGVGSDVDGMQSNQMVIRSILPV